MRANDGHSWQINRIENETENEIETEAEAEAAPAADGFRLRSVLSFWPGGPRPHSTDISMLTIMVIAMMMTVTKSRGNDWPSFSKSS